MLAIAISGFAFWRLSTTQGGASGPSWAPSPREAGRLHTIATASRSEYSLYTAHGAVHFLPGIDLGATTPGHLPGELAITPGDYARWLDEMVTIYRRPQAAPARQVTAWTDASYIHLAIRFARRRPAELAIGLDTIPTVTGRPPPGSTGRRADFALVLDPGRTTGQAWVRDQVNPDQLDYQRIDAGRTAARAGLGGAGTDHRPARGAAADHTHEPMEFQDAGLLRYGSWDPAQHGYSSQALCRMTGRVLWLRIPWAMAGMSDPSSHQALLPEGRYHVTSVTIPGIGLTVTPGPAGPASGYGALARLADGTLPGTDEARGERDPPGVRHGHPPGAVSRAAPGRA